MEGNTVQFYRVSYRQAWGTRVLTRIYLSENDARQHIADLPGLHRMVPRETVTLTLVTETTLDV